jgi:hypothetical protein
MIQITLTVVSVILSDVCLTVSASSTVPFRAVFAGSAEFTGPSSGRYDGSGVSTRGGNSVVGGDIAVTGAPSCAGGFTALHQDVLTAANGDQIYLLVIEDACPVATNVFHCVGTYSVTGGTGRFSGASGDGVFDGLVDFGAKQFTASYTGRISQ